MDTIMNKETIEAFKIRNMLIARKYLEGMSAQQLAEKYHVTRARIGMILRDQNVPKELRGVLNFPQPKQPKILTRYQLRRELNKCADEVGLKWCCACEAYWRKEDFSPRCRICKECNALKTNKNYWQNHENRQKFRERYRQRKGDKK